SSYSSAIRYLLLSLQPPATTVISPLSLHDALPISFVAAIARNPQRSGKHEIVVPEMVLDPGEGVYEVLRCARKGDSWPLLIVTDRRIVYTVYNMVTRWKVRGEVPATEVAGAELERRLLSGRLHVRRRSGAALTVKVADPAWSEHIVELIDHLAAGGAPPL